MRSSTLLSVLLLAVSAIAVPLAAEEPQQYEPNLDPSLDGPEIGSVTDGGDLEERTLSRSGAIKKPPGQNIKGKLDAKKATAAAPQPTGAADDDESTLQRILGAFSKDIDERSDPEEGSDLEERTLSRSGAIKKPPGQNVKGKLDAKKATAAAPQPTGAADDDESTLQRILGAFSKDIEERSDFEEDSAEESSDLEERTLSRSGAIKKPPGQNVKGKLDAKKATAAAPQPTGAADDDESTIQRILGAFSKDVEDEF